MAETNTTVNSNNNNDGAGNSNANFQVGNSNDVFYGKNAVTGTKYAVTRSVTGYFCYSISSLACNIVTTRFFGVFIISVTESVTGYSLVTPLQD